MDHAQHLDYCHSGRVLKWGYHGYHAGVPPFGTDQCLENLTATVFIETFLMNCCVLIIYYNVLSAELWRLILIGI